jgi:hypothetical protein
MPFGLVPILAQVFTVAVGDRQELRLVANENDTYYEAENAANASLRLDGRRSTVGLTYAPSIIVSPLENESGGFQRTTYVLHRVGLDGSIGWQPSRRSTWTLSQTANYDRSNTRAQALSGGAVPGQAPPTPGGEQPTPGGEPPTPGQIPEPGQQPTNVGAQNSFPDTVEIVTVRTQLANDYLLSRRSTLRSYIGYGGSSGVNDSQAFFPLIQGPDAGSTYGYRLGRNDDLSTILTAQYQFSEIGDRAFVASLSEAWGHRFSRYASMSIGLGVTYVYYDPDNGPPQEDIFFGSGAGGQLGVTYTTVTKLYGGRLTLFIGAAYAPALDQSRLTGAQGQQGASLTPDVRFSVFSGATWTRKRLTLYANVASIVSAEPNDPGALNSIGGQLGSIYDLGAGFSFETGARGGWQTFDGQELLAPSAALFVALNWSAVLLRE